VGRRQVTPFSALGRPWKVSAGVGRQVRWSGDGREIYYRANGKFMAVSFDGAEPEPAIGRPTPLFTDFYDFCTATSLATDDVTKDGRFIVTRCDRDAPGVQIIENWTTEMKRILDAGGVK